MTSNKAFEHRSTSVCVCSHCGVLNTCAWLYFYDLNKEVALCSLCLLVVTMKCITNEVRVQLPCEHKKCAACSTIVQVDGNSLCDSCAEEIAGGHI